MIVKNIIALIVLSLIVIFANDVINSLLNEVVNLHHVFDNLVGQVFSGGTVGNTLRQLITIFIFPALIAGIPGCVYYLMKKRSMPHMLIIFWAAWIVQAVAITL